MSKPGTATTPVQAYTLSTRVGIEALGSFFIVFAGLATALFSSSTGSSSTVGFAYGLALVACLICFGHITTGYFNPAFSLAMAVAGKIKWSAMVLFIVAQTIGAIFAPLVLLVLLKAMPADKTPVVGTLFGALANGFDSHSPSTVSMLGVLIIDVVAMAVLVALILGATSKTNKSKLGPVGIGLAFAIAVTVTMPVSNGSLNPARATAVVFFADSWAAGQLWLFWLAPLFGAALAAAIYRSFGSSRTLADANKAEHDVDGSSDSSLTDDYFDASNTSKGSKDAAMAAAEAKEIRAAEEAKAAKAAAAVVPEPVSAANSAAKKNEAQEFFDGNSK